MVRSQQLMHTSSAPLPLLLPFDLLLLGMCDL